MAGIRQQQQQFHIRRYRGGRSPCMRTRLVNTHEAILRPTLKLGLQPNNARRLPFQPLGLMAVDDVEQVFFRILHRFLLCPSALSVELGHFQVSVQ